MDKKQMKETAKSVFERYTDKEKVFITSDGQAFFDEPNAKNHAVKNRTGKELVLESFLRIEFDAAKTAKPKSVADKSATPEPTVSGKGGTPEVKTPADSGQASLPAGSVSGAKTAKALIADISEVATPEEVQTFLETEKEGENRTTVVAACEKRIDELNALKA